MGSRGLLAGAAMAAAMLALFGGSSAKADVVNLGGYLGPLTIKYSNYEGFSEVQTLPVDFGGTTYNVLAPAVGSQNFGIFSIGDVLAGGLGSNILDKSQYTYVGIFYGITTTNVAGVANSSAIGFSSTTTGGTFQLYQIPNANINLTNVEKQGLAGYTNGGCSSTTCYNGITNATGATDVLNWTLGSSSPTYTLLNPTTGEVVNTGHASATGTVSGGTDQWQFAPTLTVQNGFCVNDGTGTGQCGSGVVGSNGGTPTNFTFLSQDPVAATSVPEPASLVLFGSGLLGLGLLRRRRRRA